MGGAGARAATLHFCIVILAMLSGARPAAAADTPPLELRLDVGEEINSFIRAGDTAAHLVLRSGRSPRILVAFPAGDSGVALWFHETSTPVLWTLIGRPRPVVLRDAKLRQLRGIEAEASIDADQLGIGRALLSSVRVLRDAGSGGRVPASVLVRPLVAGSRIVWSRDRLDGAAGYWLAIEVLDGGTVSAEKVAGGPSGRLHLRIVAASGERPLTPLGGEELLRPAAAGSADLREREVLEFLSYREKFLAGSWRFDTYFGRDTLMSLMLLAPVLQPQAMESGLRSVLARLAEDGEVAHEEAIGEYAILANAAAGRGLSPAPVYDYSMIDESFLLAPVAARWLLDSPQGRRRAAEFLASRNETGEREGTALARNLLWVVRRTASFAARPVIANLVGLEPGQVAGNWRDSPTGLGGGRYPYDVNAVLVPSALDAAGRLVRSGVLDPYVTRREKGELSRAVVERNSWRRRAPPLFLVRVPALVARADVVAYARTIGVGSESAVRSVRGRAVAFDALALDGSGRPIPVMNSDVGSALLLESPSAAVLERMLTVLRPFPAGLATPVGIVVADPAYADRAVQAMFTSRAYHGTVIWSWQQALLEAGLDRQLARGDLPRGLRGRLAEARARVDAVVEATSRYRTSELWSWGVAQGRYRVVPFQQQGGGVEEADAAQLWSTVFLGVGSGVRCAALRLGCQKMGRVR